jgi:hypothetical protein
LNRREFFARALDTGVALSAGGIALLEEQLWTPTKTIILPPRGGWVAGKYGYTFYDHEVGHGALPFGSGGPEFATMAAAMRSATATQEDTRAYEEYVDDHTGEVERFFYGYREFVVWTQPAGTQAPFGRRVVYNSSQ